MHPERLGDCLAVFDVKRGLLIGAILVWAFCCCLGAFLMAGAVLVPIPPRGNPLVHYGLFLTVGGTFLLLSAYLLFHTVRHIGLRVSLHPGGLAILRGDRLSVLPWDEIEVVWHKQEGPSLSFEDYLGSMLGGSQSVYTLRGPGGERVVLNSLLRDQETLGRAIRRETTCRLLPLALQAYKVEGHVPFGKLAVSREGLSKGGRTVPWSDVGGVDVQNGVVLVRKRDGRRAWFGVRMGKVPNLYVYLALVEMLLDRAANEAIVPPEQ
jgi:hypothetical protein